MVGVVSMDPCQLNALVTALANHLFSTLTAEEFALLNVVVSELGKSMFSLTLMRDVLKDKGNWL